MKSIRELWRPALFVGNCLFPIDVYYRIVREFTGLKTNAKSYGIKMKKKVMFKIHLVTASRRARDVQGTKRDGDFFFFLLRLGLLRL